ncbi:hypothetical protein BY458DRAFT_513075 [Sporodiniella umbellata]|nr:hypothetical protein BY458DRAFT_513075 [Sporodiniella umbellata]
MKLLSTLAIVFLAATSVSAWDRRSNKEINQNSGGAGNSASKGLASGLLKDGVLSSTDNKNNVEQNAKIN